MVYLDESMHIRMGKIKLKKLLMGGILFVLVIIYLFSSHIDSKQVGFVDFNRITEKLSRWLEGQVLGISYEERFCRQVKKWNSSSEYPPVKIVAKQLNIEDGDSVFINGLHCGEWVVALKGTFPNIKLYGVDKDPDSIKYVNKLVNGTYEVSEPFELNKADFPHDLKVDHAIVDGILSIYSEELQCETIRQMIPMLKAAGSLYIGKNFEQCDENKQVEAQMRNYLHVQVLPKCFWSQKCLNGRSDVAEILYSHENIMLSKPIMSPTHNDVLERKKETLLNNFSTCATSIFIYRHIMLMSRKDSNALLPDSKYLNNKHNHVCTHSETVNSTKLNNIMDSDVIKEKVKDMKIKGLDI